MSTHPTMTAEEVRNRLQQMWKTFSSKEKVDDFYSNDARVFGSMTTRVELGRLAAVRREREYYHPETSIEMRITTPIDVAFWGEVAVASYSCEFHANNTRIGLEKIAEEHLKNGRITHVLAREEDGLRIVHEHFSQADNLVAQRAKQTKTQETVATH